jgi:hypothetical protein
MIRPFPCVWLAPTQTGQGSDDGAWKAVEAMWIRYIPYRIYQLSLNLSVLHNMPVSSISPLEK